jgi:hypothetical protein
MAVVISNEMELGSNTSCEGLMVGWDGEALLWAEETIIPPATPPITPDMSMARINIRTYLFGRLEGIFSVIPLPLSYR